MSMPSGRPTHISTSRTSFSVEVQGAHSPKCCAGEGLGQLFCSYILRVAHSCLYHQDQLSGALLSATASEGQGQLFCSHAFMTLRPALPTFSGSKVGAHHLMTEEWWGQLPCSHPWVWLTCAPFTRPSSTMLPGQGINV